MIQQDPLETLAHAVAQGDVPDRLTARARDLLDDAARPIRLGILGWPKAGKAAVLQFLAGAPIWPADQPLPTIQASHSAQAAAVCTLADGRKTTHDSGNIATITAQNPIFVDLHLPLPSLARMSLLHVAGADDTEAMTKACHWAGKRCDLLIWCGHSFDARSQTVWTSLPDATKDNALFVLTDAAQAPDMQTVQQAAGDEFQHILVLDTAAAITAQQQSPDLLAASGGLALIAVLRDAIEQRQTAARVRAAALLAQCKAPQPPQPKATPPHHVCQIALDHITTHSRDLAQAAPDQMIAQIARQLDHVSALLDDPAASDPALAAMRAAAYDAADLAQLLVMEKRDSVADDAICLLAQITQDLQAAARLP
jgi:hypothetical protein